MENLGLQLPISMNRDPAAGDWQLKAPRAARAGIHVQHAFLLPDLRPVAMPTEHSCESSGCGVEIEPIYVVQEVEVSARESNHLSFRQQRARAVLVDVAAYRSYRSDSAQRFQYSRVAHVAEMQDVV